MINNCITVIIPVYNVEQYIARCLDSVLAQTYTNLDVLIVDDGSPDNSIDIAQRYAERDPRIRIIRQENGGICKTRNTALDAVRGEWIAFLDSDDSFEPEAMEKLLAAAKKNETKMSMCGYYLTYHDRDIKKAVCKEERVIRGTEEMQRYFLTEGLNLGYVWIKLFHRSVFDNIRFPLVRAYEDVAVQALVAEAAGSCAIINEPLYNYYQRDSSLTHAVQPEYHHMGLQAVMMRMEYVRATHPQLEPLARDGVLSMCSLLLGRMVRVRRQEDTQPVWSENVSAFRENMQRAALHSPMLKGAAILFRISPVLLGWMCAAYGKMKTWIQKSGR